MPITVDTRQADFEELFAALLGAKREVEPDVDAVVAAILDAVRAEGDAALIRFTRELDGLDLSADSLRVSDAELDAARDSCASEALKALEFAAKRISNFHAHQRPEDIDYRDQAGIRLGLRWTPIASVGLYVPGGTAAYPSSVLMNALPARVAGVERLVMTVPAPKGELNPLVLSAAQIAGVTEVYKVGGAQAVGALAYGTSTIRPVDKIVGPGNAYVAAAKRRVFGAVGIDLIAGPSEILVIADGANDPSWIAADLLSQAEHDAAAQSILITDDADFAKCVFTAVESQLESLPRVAIARRSWNDFGAIITVGELADAAQLADRIAPEHLELAVADPEALAARIRNAGAIFLGRYAPEALGDYVAGPNHVLPTAGSARFSSGLGVLDFMKRSTLIGCDAEGFAAIAPAAETLARAEGLDAHALSLAVRANRQRF
jgi:histidinol dehydrogenase